MRNFYKMRLAPLAGITVLTLLITSTIIACNNGLTSGGNKNLEDFIQKGTVDGKAVELVISSSGRAALTPATGNHYIFRFIDTGIIISEGKIKVEGSNITFIPDSGETFFGTYSKNTVTLTGKHNGSTFSFGGNSPTTSSTPNSSSPNSSGASPDSNGTSPDSSSGTFPGSSGSFPGSNGSFPVSSGYFPDSSGSFPGSSGSFPDSSSTFPDSSNTFPDSSGSFPDSSSTFPDSSGAFPGSSGMLGVITSSAPVIYTVIFREALPLHPKP